MKLSPPLLDSFVYHCFFNFPIKCWFSIKRNPVECCGVCFDECLFCLYLVDAHVNAHAHKRCNTTALRYFIEWQLVAVMCKKKLSNAPAKSKRSLWAHNKRCKTIPQEQCWAVRRFWQSGIAKHNHYKRMIKPCITRIWTIQVQWNWKSLKGQ